MSVRDYQSFRGNSYPLPHGSLLHKLVTCDVCGITIGLWLPDKLPAKYANWPIKCDYPTCKSQDMNTETPTTAAELLAEWKILDYDLQTLDDGNTDLRQIRNRVAEIAARLDELCEKAGISINDGVFAYNSDTMSWALGYGGGYRHIGIPAREQQALQEWLLIKNENGK